MFLPLLGRARWKGAKGGRGSGKSHHFAENMICRAVNEPGESGGEGLRAVCLREIQKDLRHSSKLLIEDKIRKLGVSSSFKVYDKLIATPGDGIITFQGMQNHTADSVKSLEGFKIASFEEAQNASQHSLDLLRPTIRAPGSELWFAWNPNDKDDPIEQLLVVAPPPGAIVVEANWPDNPWFPPDLRLEMEYDRERDPEKYAHVWLGKYRSRSEAQVFKNWRIAELEVPKGSRPYFGADWGFAKDPTVLLRSHFIGARTFYIDREAYRVGCEIDLTPALFAGSDVAKPRRWENPNEDEGIEGAAEWPIRADSARPETISYMNKRGFNVTAALKGPSSIEDGVEFLKSYDIVVHPDCEHVIDELTHYAYKVDPRTEEVLPVLADKKNNTIDAARYAVEEVRRHQSVYGPEKGIAEPGKAIPSIWQRIGAAIVDARRCAVVWAAYDRQTDVVHVYDAYSVPRTALPIHAEAIRSRGRWIPVIMAAPEAAKEQEEAERIAYSIADQGVDLMTVPFNLQAGVEAVSARLQTGRLKVFETLDEWFREFRNFGRDEAGDIVDERQELMRATALIVVHGLEVAISETKAASDARGLEPSARNRTSTGY